MISSFIPPLCTFKIFVIHMCIGKSTLETLSRFFMVKKLAFFRRFLASLSFFLFLIFCLCSVGQTEGETGRCSHVNRKPVFFCQFCTAALEHSASAVRELAVRIIISMYQQHRAAVLSYLPPNDAATRKNFLYKTLFDGFAKIDGKLVETQARIVLFFFSLQMNLLLIHNIFFTQKRNTINK